MSGTGLRPRRPRCTASSRAMDRILRTSRADVGPRRALPPAGAAEISPTHRSTSSGAEIDEPDGADQRDDVPGDGPAVLVVGAHLDPSLLGRQPHRLQELAERVARTAGSPGGDRLLVSHRGPLGLERPQLAHPAPARGRVVARHPHHPLAPLPVHLRLANVHPLHSRQG